MRVAEKKTKLIRRKSRKSYFCTKNLYVYRLDLVESGLFICGNSKANEENMMTGPRVHMLLGIITLYYCSYVRIAL